MFINYKRLSTNNFLWILNTKCNVYEFFGFLFFKQYVSKIKIKKKLKNKIVLLSNLSFTIYLIHDAIMTLVLKSGLEGLLDRPVSGVLVLSVLIYLISLLIALVIKKIYEILKILI